MGSYTWAEADADAKSRGGRLAILNSRDKIEAAYAYLSSILLPINIDLWNTVIGIGLTDAAQEGIWKWVTDETLVDGDWYFGEPNGYSSENYCGIIYNLFAVGLPCWNDIGATAKISYLLEKPGPIITLHPVGTSIAYDSSATLSVAVTANGIPAYQWKKNGVDIPNAAQATGSGRVL
jgi:hypothetical protein